MIRTTLDPASLVDPVQRAWWDAWLVRADAATGKAVDAFEKWLAGKRKKPFAFEFNSQIWKDLKDWLMANVFFKRCAYCERLISGYYGDAEHYRPKGAVRQKDAAGELVYPTCQITNPANGQFLTIVHPGYFWLAYDWSNLLPSCVYCNSGLGKNDRFDVQRAYVVLTRLDPAVVDAMEERTRPRKSKKWPGFYYPTPAALDAEEGPLLLNPLNTPDERSPHEHIRFGVRGIVTAFDNSPLGLNTIEVCRLKDEELRQARQQAQSEFQDKFYDKMRRYDPESGQTEADRLLKEFSEGRYPFSAAVLDFYEGTLIKRFPGAPRR